MPAGTGSGPAEANFFRERAGKRPFLFFFSGSNAYHRQEGLRFYQISMSVSLIHFLELDDA